MASPSYSVLYSAVLHGSAASGSAGDVLIPVSAGGSYVLSTTAARSTRRSHGIALGAYSPGGVVEIQQSGVVDSSIAGLGAGTASWVRVSSAGRLERCNPSGTDDVVGRVEADGTFHAWFGVLTPEMTLGLGDLQYSVGPSGSGARYTTDGTADEVEINAAITACNAAGGGSVLLLAGTYSLTSPITLLSNVVLQGAGVGVTKVVAAVGYSNSYRWMVNAQGSATTGTVMALAADAAFGDQSLTINASSETAALAYGDHIFVRADRNADPIVTSNRYVGEFVKVLSVVSNTVYIWNTLRDSYATANSARAYRITFVQNCGVRGIEFYQLDARNTRTGNASIITFILTKNAFVTDCLIHDNDGPGITMSQTIGTKIVRNQIRDLTNLSPAFGYGVLIGGASEGFVVEGNSFENVRHAVDGGPHGADPVQVNTYGIPRGGAIVGNAANRVLAASYTTHSDAEGWLWSGNTASNGVGHGFYLRGRGMMIQGNTVVQCTAGIEIGDTSFNGSGGSAAGSSVVGNTVRYCKKLTSTVQYTNANVGQSNASGDGIILGLTDNVTVSGNVIEYTDGAGIAFKRGACKNIVRNNTILNANLLNAAATAAGSSAITFDAPYRSTTATINMSGTTATVTTGSTIDDIMIGKTVIVHDCVNTGNNGSFTVLSKPTSSTFTYTNAAGVNEAGTVQYVVESVTDNIIEGNVARNTTSTYDPNSAGYANYVVCDLGVTVSFPSSSVHNGGLRNVIRNNVGVGMVSGLLSVVDSSYMAGNSSGEGVPVAAKAGAPVDANFLSTPQTGTLAQNTTTGKLYIRGASLWEPVAGHNVALTSNFTTTAATSTDTNLSFPVKSGETWQFEFKLTTDCNNTGGTKFQISGPATSTVLAWVESSTTTSTSVFRQRINAINTLNSTATHTVASTVAPDKIWGVVTAASDGTIALGVASVTAGQTTTVYALSSVRATKVVLA